MAAAWPVCGSLPKRRSARSIARFRKMRAERLSMIVLRLRPAVGGRTRFAPGRRVFLAAGRSCVHVVGGSAARSGVVESRNRNEAFAEDDPDGAPCDCRDGCVLHLGRRERGRDVVSPDPSSSITRRSSRSAGMFRNPNAARPAVSGRRPVVEPSLWKILRHFARWPPWPPSRSPRRPGWPPFACPPTRLRPLSCRRPQRASTFFSTMRLSLGFNGLDFSSAAFIDAASVTPSNIAACSFIRAISYFFCALTKSLSPPPQPTSPHANTSPKAGIINFRMVRRSE